MPRFQGIFDIVLRLILSIFAAKDLYALFTKSVKKCNGNVQGEGGGGTQLQLSKKSWNDWLPIFKGSRYVVGPNLEIRHISFHPSICNPKDFIHKRGKMSFVLLFVLIFFLNKSTNHSLTANLKFLVCLLC